VSDDRGSASVLAAAMTAVLVMITVAGIYVGAAVIARHRAQAAADLAALAAAGRLAAGGEAACTQAVSIATAMRTAIADCTVDELDVTVTAEVSVELGRFGVGTARAAARAGPVGRD
jgi:secretion/DNA translocation related TadE-like protein